LLGRLSKSGKVLNISGKPKTEILRKRQKSAKSAQIYKSFALSSQGRKRQKSVHFDVKEFGAAQDSHLTRHQAENFRRNNIGFKMFEVCAN